jgi:hypothetical protein
LLFAIRSRKFGTKFPEIFKTTELLRHELHEWSRISRHLSQLIWVNSCGFVSGADGIGDTEGKAAMGSGERAGRQASFKFVSRLPMSEGFRAFGVFRGQEDYPQPILDAFKQ